MKFESKTYYSKPVVEIAEETPADVLDQEIEQATEALAELERQAEIQRKADSLATLQQAQKRQQDAAIAEKNLSACIGMVTQSTDALKIKAGDFHNKFQDLAKLCREVRALYDEVQHIAYTSGLKLKNATNAASQIEPSPDFGAVVGEQSAIIRFNKLLNEVGLTDDTLDLYPAGMSPQDAKLFSIVSDDRPGARFKPNLGSKNFDNQKW